MSPLKNKERMLDDIARVAGGAASVFSGLHQNAREDLRARIDEIALRLELVPREDFERLQERVETLEKQIQEMTKSGKKK